MAQTKRIDTERWPEYMAMFSNGNRGRAVSIELAGAALGDQPASGSAPLFAIDYDPEGKGDDLVVSTGSEDVDYTHTIHEPSEIWESQDDNGEVVSIEILDREGVRTILSFTT